MCDEMTVNDYCITFVHVYAEPGREPDAVYHCHVMAPDEKTALEGAFHMALAQNYNLTGTNEVAIRQLIPIQLGMLEAFESLRKVVGGTTAAVAATPQVPPGCTLH